MTETETVFEAFAGTYEEFLLGVELTSNKESEFKLKQTVADHSHKASVRTVATGSNVLVTGGADETLQLYDLKSRRHTGTLNIHNGTVTCVCFTPDGKHMISSSEDGTIAITRLGSWQVEKIWKRAHSGHSVLMVAVHPSGRLALSLGSDGSVRTWDLTSGKQIFSCSPSSKSRAELVIWSRDGSQYALGYDTALEVRSVATATVDLTLNTPSRLVSASHLQSGLWCCGLSDGSIIGFSMEGERRWSQTVSSARIKAVSSHESLILAADSSGGLHVLREEADRLEAVTTLDTGCRIICLALTCHCHSKQPEKKIKQGLGVKLENVKLELSSKTPEVDKNSKRKASLSPRKKKRVSAGTWTIEES